MRYASGVMKLFCLVGKTIDMEASRLAICASAWYLELLLSVLALGPNQVEN